MLEYVFAHNIDDRILKRADFLLRQNKLVAFPTDSNWSICCSILSKEGIDKLRKLKHGLKDFTLSVICEEISQVEEIVKLSNHSFKILKKHLPGPYVFILPAKKNIEKIINMKRPEIGIRIPDHPIPQALSKIHGHPLFAITASREMGNNDWWDHGFALENLYSQGWELEDIDDIELIIDTGEEQMKNLTSVIDLTHDEVEIIREGIGDLSNLR